MTTIHNTLLLCRRLNILNQNINEQINTKLVILLQQICNVDLTNDPTPFIQTVASFGIAINIEYKFKYGTVSIIVDETSVAVSFFFILSKCKNIYIPFQSHHCYVDVDNNLNFKKAVFNYAVHIVKTTIQSQPSSNYVGTLLVTDPSYVTIYFQRVIDENHQISTFVSYQNHHSKHIVDGSHKEITPTELNQHYFQPNKQFEDFFVNVMRKYAAKPKQFDSVFVDYPTHQNFMNNKQSAVIFLNLLSEQYFNNFYLIESNLLLLDMQEI